MQGDCIPNLDSGSEEMCAQEGCRNAPVGDAPSGRDAAWGVFVCGVMVCILHGLFCNLPYGKCTLVLVVLYYFMDLIRCKYINT